MLRQALIPPGSLILSVRCANGFTRERRRIVLPVPHPSKPIILHTRYHPPFNWSALLQFLHSRATPQEWVTENAYHRLINGHQIIVAQRTCQKLPQHTDTSRAIISRKYYFMQNTHLVRSRRESAYH